MRRKMMPRARSTARTQARLAAAAAALVCGLGLLGAAPASAAGAGCQGWAGNQPPPVAGEEISGMAVASACDVWVLGNKIPAGGSPFQPFLQHWTGGSSWTLTPIPVPASAHDTELRGISALSPTDAWAVGQTDEAGNVSHSFIIHWDGTSWTRTPSPNPSLGAAGDLELNAVYATSASDVWAVGTYTPVTGGKATLIEHWNGTSWLQVPSPSPGAHDTLFSVTAVSANLAWAVGNTFNVSTRQTVALIEMWNGTVWTPVTTSAPGNGSVLSSVSADSANDAWATGVTTANSGFSTGLVEHWDGSSWTPRSVPIPPEDGSGIQAVYAAAPGNAWIIGNYADVTETVHSFALHLSGTTWSPVAEPAGIVPQVMGASAVGDLWITGQNSAGNQQQVVGTLAQAPVLVAANANATLAERGLAARSLTAANLAPGTNPAVAVQPDGSSLTAWQAAGGLLWTLDSAGHQVNTQQKVAAGTSPGIAALAGGGYEIVFTSAADGTLRAVGPDGTVAALGSGPAVAAGTSPAIAAAPAGGFEVAYHAAGTDHLWTAGTGNVSHDTGAVMAAGASPAVTALAGRGFELVFPAASGALTGIAPGGSAQALGSGPGVAAGTSPAAAADASGTLEVVYQAAGGELWIVNAGTARDAGVAAAAHTSPGVAALATGGFQIAYQAATGRELFTLASGGPWDTRVALGVGDSPVMAVLPLT